MSYTNPQSINMSKGFGEIFIYINEVTNQVFSIMLMLSIWVIVALGYYKASGDISSSIGVASFSIFSVGLLFWIGGMITGWVFAGVIAFAIVGIGVLLLSKE